MKKIFNTFINNKWHLHSLTLPFNILFVWLMTTYNFLSLNDTGKLFQIFICVFSSAAVAFLVEWVQGVFFGANKTISQVKASNLDILVGVLAGTIGVLSAIIFPNALNLAWISLIVITLSELYRRHIRKIK